MTEKTAFGPQALLDSAALLGNVQTASLSSIDLSADAFGHGASFVLSSLASLTNLSFTAGRQSEVDDLRRRYPGLHITCAPIDEFSVMSAYGLRSNNQGFLPVMTLSAPVVAVKSIRQGGGVSYGYTWKADADGFLALVGLGYADGFDRAWGNRINAHRGESLFPAVGRVAMDAHTVSTGNEELTVGDMLTYFGVLGTSCIYAEELALSVGGSPLTVTANLGLRIARVVS